MKEMMRWGSWIADTAIIYNVLNSGLHRKIVALSVRPRWWLDAETGGGLVLAYSMLVVFGYCFSFYPTYLVYRFHFLQYMIKN